MVRRIRSSIICFLARFRPLGGIIAGRRYPGLYMVVTEIFAAGAIVVIFVGGTWLALRQLAEYGWK